MSGTSGQGRFDVKQKGPSTMENRHSPESRMGEGANPAPENEFAGSGHASGIMTARQEDADGSDHYLSRKPTTGATVQRSCSSCGSVDHEELDLPVQPSLEVSSPDEPAEREADAVAAQVMEMDDPTEGPISRRIDGGMSVQRAGTGAGGEITGEAESAVKEATRGNGKSLPTSVRREFEPKFGADFGNVSIHESPEAASSINAKAYTLGSDIVFNKGEYEPGTKSGKKLLAHELTHTIQQGGTSDRA